MNRSGIALILIILWLYITDIFEVGVNAGEVCFSFDSDGTIACEQNQMIWITDVEYHPKTRCRGKATSVMSCDNSGEKTTFEYLEDTCDTETECSFTVSRCNDYRGRSTKVYYYCEDIPTTVPTTTTTTTTRATTTKKSSPTTKGTTTASKTITTSASKTTSSNSSLPGDGVNAAHLNESSSDAGAIAGGIIGGLIFILIVVILFIIIRRRRMKDDQEKVLGTRENRASLTASTDEPYYETPEDVVSRSRNSNTVANARQPPGDLPIRLDNPPLYSLERINDNNDVNNPGYVNSPSSDRNNDFSPGNKTSPDVPDDVTYAPVYAEPEMDTARGVNTNDHNGIARDTPIAQNNAIVDPRDSNYYSVATLVEPPEYSISKPVPLEHVAGSKYLVFERDQGLANDAPYTNKEYDQGVAPCADEFGYSHLDDRKQQSARPSNYDDLILSDDEAGVYANVSQT